MEIKVDYNHSLVSLISSVTKYFKVETIHSTLKELDSLLYKDNVEWKNIVVLLFDGMGTDALETLLKPESFLRQNFVTSISSVFPPTTVAATTALCSGLTPAESGWIGWNLYFPELDKNICIFPNTIQDTKLQAADYHAGFRYLPYKSVFDKIGENKAFHVSRFGTNRTNTLPEMFTEIKRLCTEPGQKYIYGYEETPDIMMHVAGTYSNSVKKQVKLINDSVKKFCDDLHKMDNVGNTLVLVVADHGHIAVENIILENYVDFVSMLKRPISIESRCANFFVKDEFINDFPAVFNKTFNHDNTDFVLLTKEEVLQNKIFGNITDSLISERFKNVLLGDFIAISVSNKAFVNSSKSNQFKSHHAGYTDKEMKVPFIAIEIKKDK